MAKITLHGMFARVKGKFNKSETLYFKGCPCGKEQLGVDLLNPSKTENYKNDIAEFRAMFEKSPMGFIYYEFQPPMSLSVRLYPWDCEEAYYNMDKVMLSPYNDDKVPEYKWDGVKFVKQ